MERHALAVIAAALLAGCNGVITDTTATAGGGGASRRAGGGGVLGGDSGLCGDAILPGPLGPFRRLTRHEYDNTVRDLLGDTSHPAEAFPPDEDLHGFELGATVSPLHFELYMTAAERIAANVDVAALTAAPCAGATGEACARAFIERFGPRAYRRPIETTQIDRLLAVYRVGIADGGHADGIRMVIEAMLQSPYFLYRVELGGTPPESGVDVVALTQHERATRLSYLLWNTMPDETLFAAAGANELETREQIAVHARRMLDDPRAQEAMRHFYMQWLELDFLGVTKDPERYPEWSDELAASMTAEAERFIDHVLWQGNATLDELLTAPYSFVDARLAAVYGVEGTFGDELVRVDLDPSKRAGLLTLPGLMATHARPEQSSPVLRGKFVRERILCQELPPPPPDLVVVPPDPDPSLSTRERFEQHRTDPACVGCHAMMDPIGYGFENFDAIGRWRDTDEGFTVDATGEIVEIDGGDATFDGPVELAHRLASSEDVRQCVGKQWLRAALGRTETNDDECTLASVHEAFEASGWDLRELLVALVQTDAFLYRRATTTEAP